MILSISIVKLGLVNFCLSHNEEMKMRFPQGSSMRLGLRFKWSELGQQDYLVKLLDETKLFETISLKDFSNPLGKNVWMAFKWTFNTYI